MGRQGSSATSAALREAILSAALGEFAVAGIGASLTRIAERAGVTRATLVRHYPHRSNLIAAVLHRYGEFTLPPSSASQPSPSLALHALLLHATQDLSRPGIAALKISTSTGDITDNEVRRFHRRRHGQITRWLTEVFESYRSNNLLAPGIQPAWAARATVALMDGLQIQHLTSPGSVDVVADLHYFIGTLLARDAEWDHDGDTPSFSQS